MTTPFSIRKDIHDIDTNTYFFVVKATIVDGSAVYVLCPRAELANPTEVHRKLLDDGADVTNDRKGFCGHFKKALEAAKPAAFSLSQRIGWHHDGMFVTRDRTYRADKKVQPVRHRDRIVRGKPKAFSEANFQRLQNQLLAFASWSPYAAFSIAAGFTGPLLGLLDEREGALFYFGGKTGTGKTSLLLMAQALKGPADHRNLLTFDVTEARMQENASDSNDMTMVVDELGRTKGDLAAVVKRLAYGMAGGQGRQRSKAAAIQQAYGGDVTWRTILLASGELDIDAFSSRQQQQGQLVRLIQVAMPQTLKETLFANAGFDDAEAPQHLQALQQAAQTHDGYAMHKFLSWLVKHRQRAIKEANAIRHRFLKNCGATGQVEQRIAQKFALVAAAGHLAGLAKVMPWDSDAVVKAVRQVYDQRESVAGQRVPADDAALRHAMQSLVAKATSQRLFPRVSSHGAIAANQQETAVGFRRKVNGKEIVYIAKNHVKAVLDVTSVEPVLDKLKKHGVLLTDKNRNSSYHSQVRVRGFVAGQERISVVAMQWSYACKIARTLT